MSSSLESIRLDKRLIAHTAAAIYGGAAFNGLVESLIPGDPRLSMIPGLIALAMFAMLLAVGPRLPRRWLAPVGPIGVALIAYALSESPGAGDGAILYTWPVLWTAFFFGRRGAVAIMACIAIAHGVTLLELPADSSFAGRWIDVFVSLSVVAAVVETLARRSDSLLARLAGEARTDTLTGLLNRRGFDERAAFELAHARRDSGSVAAVAFDIDRFKHINDEWGHEIGDRVLARVGGLLAEHSREIDVTARLGGDEFVVLLPGGARA
ncbi:MAG: GGDEF domain-containing protein, partial [Solirubrobacterales bacterium]|nr:GGDEF domain-containing protein [Solirubrobacterales bacterium]